MKKKNQLWHYDLGGHELAKDLLCMHGAYEELDADPMLVGYCHHEP